MRIAQSHAAHLESVCSSGVWEFAKISGEVGEERNVKCQLLSVAPSIARVLPQVLQVSLKYCSSIASIAPRRYEEMDTQCKSA